MDQPLVEAGERIDDLQRNGLRIIQRADGFRFGTDAVLLADFARAKRGERVCDVGTGTGVLPLLIAARSMDTTFDAVEIQPEVADMARRSVALNAMEDRIRVHNMDCRDAPAGLGHECFHLVVTNPPYTAAGAGLISPQKTRAVSRSDSDCSLEAWMIACGKLLKNGGRLACVFPAPRLLQLCDAMRAGRVEPKRLRLVASGASAAPKLALLEGLKGGRPGLHMEPLLITHDEQGGFTAEMKRIYGEI